MADISLGLSFDDVLLVPALSSVLPGEADLSTHVTANKAIDSASQPIAVRPEAVARGRALLEGGQLGNDATALADVLISRMLNHED